MSRQRRWPGRPAWVLVHRYVGLSLALFLIVSGATGAAIAFQDELDEWLNADWFRTGRSDPPLPPQQLIAALERTDARLRVQYLPVGLAPGRAARVMVEPRADGDPDVPSVPLEFDEMFVDPATGQVLGTRRWGECCLDRRKLMPFLYELHHRLLLPGEWGRLLLGTVALLWTLDCVVGLYLTLPRTSRHSVAGPAAPLPSTFPVGWRRWLGAWSIKRGSSWTRLNWDLHRAGGLWFWVALLALASSGVSLNLGDKIVEPALSAFSELTPSPFDAREDTLAEQPVEPRLSFDDALTKAQAEALRAGWTAPVGGVFYNADYGIYGVHFGRDKDTGWGARYVYLDGVDGSLLGRHEPGTGTGADRFMDLQLPLHSGRILGTAGRALIAASGIAVVMLTVTGVVIWSRKRRAQSHRALRSQGAPAGE